jgi:RNA polymerase sigma factor (sigma-70 family)
VSAEPEVEGLLRELAPRALAALARRYRDFDLAEDAVQEALISAATGWSAHGPPENPLGWLVVVANRRMSDLLRNEDARRREEVAITRDVSTQSSSVPDEDDLLPLLFMCAHPALTPASAIPLTLRAVAGLTTDEIARAFLVPEPTMAQRISRAKQRLRSSRVPFALPTSTEWADRTRSVLHVLYLLFTEGYSASSGTRVTRAELSTEAIRLTRLLHARLPQEPEVAGLLALMLLNEARRPARTGPRGRLVPLDVQDRTRWNPALIAEGVDVLTATLPLGPVGEYQLLAAIAAVHDEAATADETDWPQILRLCGLLEAVTDNPMVTLNRAVAVSMVHGPDAGLELLDGLTERLRGHHRLEAVRAHLLERAGRLDDAVHHYRAAALRTTSVTERDYLLTRAKGLIGLEGPASDAVGPCDDEPAQTDRGVGV